jgi:formylglycine-generating enzyme required for sulfatase activity
VADGVAGEVFGVNFCSSVIADFQQVRGEAAGLLVDAACRCVPGANLDSLPRPCQQLEYMDPVKTVHIFLSSPGDVAAERAEVRDLLLGLARGPFVRGRVLIDVVSWDDPYAGATMDARLTPQQAVDRSLPTPAQCDLTVVLLWGRMGTPLTEMKADGTPYLSGTEWEFENALSANKPLLVYRRAEKVLLDPDDPEFDEKVTQKRRVDAFFGRFRGAGRTILRAHATYASSDDLLDRLRQDVERYLSELLHETNGGGAAKIERVGPGQSAAIAAGPPQVPVAYREWVKKQHGGVDLLGLQLKKGRPPSLGAIYVPQTTTPVASGDPVLDQALVHFERKATEVKGAAPVLALSRLSTESLYVSGAPGTGKSTFCRWVAWLVAEGVVPSQAVPPPHPFAEVLDDGLKGRLPVLLRLREFWEYLAPRVGASFTVSDLEDAITAWVTKRRPDGLDAALLRAHLAHGSALLLLDGVDEVPVSATRGASKWLPRQQLLSALADACPTWIKAGNRMLLTSRPYGLSDDEAGRMTLGFAPLQPLPDALQWLLAYRWFAVLSADVQTGAETADDLSANIDSQPWLQELASNPLMLTAMCIVFDERKRLPKDKHELYERVVGTLLSSRYQDPADIDRVKRELGVIAYGMHTADGRTTPRAEATFHEIERWLQEYQERKGYTERSEAGVFDAREALLSQSGLFMGAGHERAGFSHLSFQEFFAAQRTFTVQEQRLSEMFLERAATPEWRNTLSLLFGRLFSSSTEPKKALDLLQALIERAAATDIGLLLVLADAAEMLTGKGISLAADRLARLRDLLLTAITGRADVPLWGEAGAALGRLGDPRFRADRLWLPDEDLLGFIRVEAGTFLLGSDPSADPDAEAHEQPQHLIELPEYYIARYPVTVAQFRAFVEDTGFEFRMDTFQSPANYPIVYVSFYDALAYCRWLTDRLKRADWMPPLLREQLVGGWAITLPSEAEWEKAARGRSGQIWPWGNPYEHLVHVDYMPSPVGCFSNDVSPYGAVDMGGNVEEWTRSLWGEDPDTPAYAYPYDPKDARRHDVDAPNSLLRVLRGESAVTLYRRVAARHRASPDATHALRGLRLVFSPPPQ